MKEQRSLYEDIINIREFAEVIKNSKAFNKELSDALMDVVTYAEDCYIEEAENIGREIIANSEVIEEKSYQKGYDDAMKSLWKSVDKYGLPKDGTHIVYVVSRQFANGYDIGTIYYPESSITDNLKYWIEIPELPEE